MGGGWEVDGLMALASWRWDGSAWGSWGGEGRAGGKKKPAARPKASWGSDASWVGRTRLDWAGRGLVQRHELRHRHRRENKGTRRRYRGLEPARESVGWVLQREGGRPGLPLPWRNIFVPCRPLLPVIPPGPQKARRRGRTCTHQ